MHEVPDKAQRVQAMFDGIVHRYERVNTVTTLGLDAAWRRQLVKALDLPASAAVLDIACGTGQVLRRVARVRPRAAQLVGADFSDVMIRHARWAGPAKASFCRADALRLPFADASFDAVTCAFGVRNFAEPTVGLAEMFRVLRPGGVAGILEFSMPQPGVLGSLYRFYFRRVLPRLASWLCRDASGAYEYLQRSVETFSAVDLVEMMRGCGFEAAQLRQLTLGVVHLYTARKPTGDRT
jgi:demethylmenaquinone methyltransferase/2-methoxy-6-polyprenyl-1,4-benzoquinol methylase